MAIRKYITDDNGFEWAFDGTRVYCIEAEKEFKAEGIDVRENGYFVSSWAEALKILKEDGYISELPIDKSK